MRNYILSLWVLMLMTGLHAATVEESEDLPQRRDGGVSLHTLNLEQVAIDSTYLVGPGDFFDIFIEDRMLTVQVSPEGSIGLERVGIISVNGLPLSEARLKIKKAAESYYRNVSVQLAQMKNFRVTVNGFISIPGQQLITAQTRLSSLIRQAGGLTPGADDRSIRIMRGKDTLIVDFSMATRTGRLEYDPYLLQGDAVFIPVLVEQPAQVQVYRDGVMQNFVYDSVNVGQFLRQNKLLQGEAGSYRLLIRYADGRQEAGSYAELADKALPQGATVEITRAEEFVYVGGSTAMLGKVPYRPGYSPMSYIASAGVTIVSGQFDQIKVIRRDGSVAEIDPHNGIVEAGDYLELPKSNYERIKDLTLFMASLLGVLSSFLIIQANM